MGKEKSAPKKPASPLADEIQDPAKIVLDKGKSGPKREMSDEIPIDELVESDGSASDSSSSSSGEDIDSESDVPGESFQKNEIVESAFLDELIIRLMSAPLVEDEKAKAASRKRTDFAQIVSVKLELNEINKLCDMAAESFLKQSSLIIINRSQLPILIVGDTHGQFKDLRGIFYRCGSPTEISYLFLGDYVDRGVQGIEVMMLLLALKIKYPNRVHMLRGNHEDPNTCASYGFYDECINRFGSTIGDQIWQKFVYVFNHIPLAAVVNKSIFACHGGISPSIDSLDAIAKIKRPSIVPPFGMMCDLVWSDPDEKVNAWAMNSRGISITYGEDVTEKFCQRLNIDLIVRGHQLTRDMLVNGYRFFSKGRVLTIFSAPNYMNMRNSAAVLRVTKKMTCNFIVFKVPKRKRKG